MDRNKHLNEFISKCTSAYLGIITRLMLTEVKFDSKKLCTEALITYFMFNIHTIFVVLPGISGSLIKSNVVYLKATYLEQFKTVPKLCLSVRPSEAKTKKIRFRLH